MHGCDSEASPAREPEGIVFIAAQDPDLSEIATIAANYLTELTGLSVTTQTVSTIREAAAQIHATAPALAILLNLSPERLPTEPQAITPGQTPPPFDDRFRVAVRAVGSTANPLDGAPGTMVVDIDGRHVLSLQYGVYEALRRLGARFYHPEEEFIPRIPGSSIRARLTTATALGTGPVFEPSFIHRSFTFHGAHPLEHMEAFSNPEHPIDEAVHVNTWMVKQRGDMFRGAGRSVVTAAQRRQRAAELEELRLQLGLRRGTGITLHNQQQGGSPDIDWSSNEPVDEQIRRVVTAKLAATPDAISFGIHFGPTELTTTPDIPTVTAINLAGRTALSLRPDIVVEINDHTSGSQPVEHFGDLGCPPGTNDRGVSDYYDLAFHTDDTIGVRVHTVMFQPLVGPAGVYNQKSFNHKLCLMQKASRAGRPLSWFPEGAYWLSVDNTIPVYLPLYLATRARDVQELAPLLLTGRDGTLRGHRMFNSGHEWGYWQQDYAVGLLHWRHDVTMPEILGELGDPLCDVNVWPNSCEARDVYVATLTEVMAEQWRLFLDAPDFRGRPGGLYWYFAGEDAADELGAASGLEFRPVRVPFREVTRMPSSSLEAFERIDLAGLDASAAAYLSWVEALEEVSADVPAAGLPWLRETIDGLNINHLRAAHTASLYRAVIALREGGDPAAASASLADALEFSVRAADVIAEREASYRYPAAQIIAGPNVPNGTTYPFRVNYRTSVLAYWTNRETQVADLIAGVTETDDRLNVAPAFGPTTADVEASWPSLPGLHGTISLGETLSLEVGEVSVELPDIAQVLRVEGALETADGSVLPVGGHLVRSDDIRATKQGAFTLISPDAPVAAGVLAAVLPSIRMAMVGGVFAFGIEIDSTVGVRFDEIQIAALLDPSVQGRPNPPTAYRTAPKEFVLPIPDPASGAIAVRVRVRSAVFTVEPGWLGDAVGLDGALSTGDLVDALVELAGFDEEGAAATLADVLGLEELPEWLDFSSTIALQ